MLAATLKLTEPLPCPDAGDTCEIHGASAADAVHVQSGVVVTAILADPPDESTDIGDDESETSHLTGVGPEATWDDSHPSSAHPNATGMMKDVERRARMGMLPPPQRVAGNPCVASSAPRFGTGGAFLLRGIRANVRTASVKRALGSPARFQSGGATPMEWSRPRWGVN